MTIDLRDLDFFPASDSTLLVRFSGNDESHANEQVLALASLLQQREPNTVLNLHPAYRSLLIRFDPILSSHAEMEGLVRKQADGALPLEERKHVDVPVCYGGALGPDLEEVARLTQLTPAQVVEIHSGANYRVYFLGFAPGFPYLGGMDPRIAVPRLNSPRKMVHAGSVGIAENQTGIYPVASPGGWRLIGRTPLKLFRPSEVSPSLLLPGDTLRFRPITPDEYEKML